MNDDDFICLGEDRDDSRATDLIWMAAIYMMVGLLVAVVGLGLWAMFKVCSQ